MFFFRFPLKNYNADIVLILVLLLPLVSGCKDEAPLNGSRPNIVFIIGDDIGYSDLGCYGSEISTPHLDRLAEEGVRFRQFYNMAKCNPTRSSLHTGIYYGDDSALSLGRQMHLADYTTLFVGKEHFDKWVPEDCYAANCFDRSVTFWAMTNYFLQDDGTYPNPFYMDGKEIRPEDIPSNDSTWFLTDVLTDQAIRWLDEYPADDKPFFLYMGYLNAHYPLQAKAEDIAKYRGTYLKGWDKLREERFSKQKAEGLAGENWVLSPPSSNINRFRGHPSGDENIRKKIPVYSPWDLLSDSARDTYDLEMAVFAALVDNMDQNIGRLIAYLEESGELDNTLFIYMSDNGSCPYDSNRDFILPPGHSQSFRTLDPKWANVGNTPFRFYKQYGHEGGSNTHFIASWPGRIEGGRIIDHTGHVVDVLPTLLELAGRPVDEAKRINGISLLPLFEGREAEEHPYMVSGMDMFRMYREGDMKLVRVNGEEWQLYDLGSDPTECYNLADSLPAMVKEMSDRYDERF
ncbi:sulfatase-like hydrolase/transferase [Bacteroidota bacterium]